nr:anti-sigma factor antagonist [Mycobacteroides salmoniphilum]
MAATGALDATNADCLVYYAVRHLHERHALVLDLRELDFCGSEGFLAVLKIRCCCKYHEVRWSLLSGEAVDRILEIGDPDSWLLDAIPLIDALENSSQLTAAV